MKEWRKLPCQNTQHQVLQLFAGPADTGCPSSARHSACSCHCFVFVLMCSLSIIFLWLLPATASFPQTLPEQYSTCMPAQFTNLILLAQYTDHPVRLSLHLFFFFLSTRLTDFLDFPQNGFSHRRNLADNVGGGGYNRPWVSGTSIWKGVKERLERFV